MSEEQSESINYIFYLQSKNDLDDNFKILANVLAKIKITLLPISAENLKNIDRKKKIYLISLRSDFASALNFSNLRKTFLNSAMSAGKLVLFDVSSFSEIEEAAKFQNKNMYRYFQLPQNLIQIAMSIGVYYFRDCNIPLEWPWGRRARLPAMANEDQQ